VTLSSGTENVAGELVDNSGTVVDFNDLSSNTTFTLTAPQAGTYKINAGYKKPSRVWDSVSVTLGDLPVQLSWFTGARLGENMVRLEWQTLSEINNYGFTVQRRAAADEVFTEIPGSFVPGHGTSIVPQYYSYTDEQAGTSDWHYRLKQLDLDGTATFSDAILVSVITGITDQVPRQVSLDQNYPNPFNPSTSISYNLSEASHVSLKVYNALGEEVAKLVDRHTPAGRHEIRWDADGMPSGIYLYTIQTGTYVATKKMMMLK
jgi:hypothetical protein